MKDYYFEKMTEAQIAVDLAKVGYEAKLIRLAGELSKADISTVGATIDELVETNKVFELLEAEVNSYREKYQVELDKECSCEED
jgi:hypothetical protein